MAQSTPSLLAEVPMRGVTYKSITAATHVVAKFQTQTNMGYHVVVDLLSVAVDDYDEANSYRLIGTFVNTDGTLTQAGSTTTVHSAEDHGGNTPALAVSGTEIRVTYATDDTTPTEIRVAAQVLAQGPFNPHLFGDGANNNPS